MVFANLSTTICVKNGEVLLQTVCVQNLEFPGYRELTVTCITTGGSPESARCFVPRYSRATDFSFVLYTTY